MDLSQRVGKIDESVAGQNSRQDDVIMAGKLTVDAAARTNESLERTRARLEETGAHILLAREEELHVAPHIVRVWLIRVLDFSWPYAVKFWFVAIVGLGAWISALRSLLR